MAYLVEGDIYFEAICNKFEELDFRLIQIVDYFVLAHRGEYIVETSNVRTFEGGTH